MAENSSIEWTDATWSPITGCSVVSPGCANCYAMKLAGGRLQHHPSRVGLTASSRSGPVWNGKVRLNEAWLGQPLRWRRGREIFVCAHGDLFHPNVPDGWIDRVFGVMALAQQHRFQVLTKRSARMWEYLTSPDRLLRMFDAVIPHPTGDATLARLIDMGAFAAPLPNVMLGVSVEDEPRAQERLPALRETPAALRFVSYEPALGPVDWAPWLADGVIHQVICGGESGHDARPLHPDWARAPRDACAAAGVAFFMKQWGGWVAEDQAPENTEWDGETTPFHIFEDGQEVWKVGKRWAGRLLDGVEHSGAPELRPC